jgi:hypothetical protein
VDVVPRLYFQQDRDGFGSDLGRYVWRMPRVLVDDLDKPLSERPTDPALGINAISHSEPR